MLVLAALLGAAIASPFVFKAGKKAGFVQPPAFRQITFSRGEVGNSLFAPDGQTIVYSAGWEGKPFEIFINRPESPESRPFGLGAAEVLAISKSGEMAVSLNRHPLHSFVRSGRLARISIAGGAPRDILDDVQFADWGPDGQSLAIVRDVGIKNRLEYPIGKTLFETTGWVGQVRVSPKEELIAFVDHPFQNDDGGRIAVVDKAGKKRDLTPLYATAQGLAWTPDGREIWYTAAEGGFNRAVHAVTTSGKTRLVGRVPGISTIRDISKDGKVLMTNESARLGILERGAADEKDRELSWLDYSLVTDISPDGQKILITESGEGGGTGYSAYLRKTDDSPAIRLGAGATEAFSPDGAWAISIANFAGAESPQIVLLPTSVGEPKALSREGMDPITADFLPDGKSIVYTAIAGRTGDASVSARRRRRQVPRADPGGLLSLSRHDHAGREVRGRPRAGSPDLPLSAGRRRAAGPRGARRRSIAPRDSRRTGNTSTSRKTRRSPCGSIATTWRPASWSSGRS